MHWTRVLKRWYLCATLAVFVCPGYLLGPLSLDLSEARIPVASSYLAVVKDRPLLHWYKLAVPDTLQGWPPNPVVRVYRVNGTAIDSKLEVGVGVFPLGLAIPVRGPVARDRMERREVGNHGRCVMLLVGFDAPISKKEVQRVEILEGPP